MAEERELRLRITGKDDASRTVAAVQASLKALEQSLKNLDAAMEKVATVSTATGRTVQDASGKFAKADVAVASLARQMDALQRASGETDVALRMAAGGVNEAQQAAIDAAAAFLAFEHAADQADHAADMLALHSLLLTQRQEALAHQTERASAAMSAQAGIGLAAAASGLAMSLSWTRLIGVLASLGGTLLLITPTLAVLGGVATALASLAITAVAVAGAFFGVGAAFLAVGAGAAYALNQVGFFDAKAGTFKRDMAAVEDALLQVGRGITKALPGNFLNQFTSGIIGLIRQIAPFLDQIVSMLSHASAGFFKFASELIAVVGPKIVTAFRAILQGSGQFTQMFIGVIQTWIPLLSQIAVGIIKVLGGLFFALQPIAIAFAQGVINMFHKLGGDIKGTFAPIIPIAAQFVTEFLNALTTLVVAWSHLSVVFDGVSVALLQLANAVLPAVVTGVDAAIPFLKLLAVVIISIINTVTKLVSTPFGQFFLSAAIAIGILSKAVSVVFPLLEFLMGTIGALIARVELAATAFRDFGLAEGIGTLVPALQGLITGLVRVAATMGVTGSATEMLIAGFGGFAAAIGVLGAPLLLLEGLMYTNRQAVDQLSHATYENQKAITGSNLVAQVAEGSARALIATHIGLLNGTIKLTQATKNYGYALDGERVSSSNAAALAGTVAARIGGVGAQAIMSAGDLNKMAQAFNNATKASRDMYMQILGASGGLLGLQADLYSVYNAQLQYIASLKTVAADQKRSGTTSLQLAQDVLAAKQAHLSELQTMQQLALATVQYIDQTGKSSFVTRQAITQIDAWARAMGWTKGQIQTLNHTIETLLGDYNKIPPGKQTKITAPGLDTAAASAQRLVDGLTKAPSNTPVNTPGAAASAKSTGDLVTNIGKLPASKSVQISVPGADASIASIQTLLTELANLHDKTITITVDYVQHGTPPPGHHYTGMIGPGYGGGDIAGPYMLEPGELVVQKELAPIAARALGMRDGGFVPPPAAGGGGGASIHVSFAGAMIVTTANQRELRAFAEMLGPEMDRELKKRRALDPKGIG